MLIFNDKTTGSELEGTSELQSPSNYITRTSSTLNENPHHYLLTSTLRDSQLSWGLVFET